MKRLNNWMRRYVWTHRTDHLVRVLHDANELSLDAPTEELRHHASLQAIEIKTALTNHLLDGNSEWVRRAMSRHKSLRGFLG